jgi:hypothetical protein
MVLDFEKIVARSLLGGLMIKRTIRTRACIIAIALSALGSGCGGGDDDSGGNNGTGNNSGTGGNASASQSTGGSSGGSAGMGGGASGSTSQAPKTNCMSVHDCGISQECIACGLTDTAGWCSFKKECMFDSDCAPDKCGYNVETSEYRCLPATYCPK